VKIYSRQILTLIAYNSVEPDLKRKISRITKRITFLQNNLNSYKEQKIEVTKIGELKKNNNIPKCQSDLI